MPHENVPLFIMLHKCTVCYIEVRLHHMGLNARNPDFVACEQQTADQPEHSRSLISAFVIHYHNNGADQPAP